MRIWLCILAAALTLAGCANNQAGQVRDDGNAPRAQGLNQNADNRNMNPNAAPNQNLNRDAALPVTDHLERLASRVKGVQSARAVMLGKTAIVGIDVDGKLDRSRVGTIKYSVAEALNKDPHGANAIVTADMDITNRLTEIGNSIREGRPIAGLGNELADLIGRIVPQVPGDTRMRYDNQVNPAGNNVGGNDIPNKGTQNLNRNGRTQPVQP